MRTISLSLILALTLTSCSHKAKTKNDDVYISTSPRAYAYHEDGKSKWLVRTTYPIKKISRSKAESVRSPRKLLRSLSMRQ